MTVYVDLWFPLSYPLPQVEPWLLIDSTCIRACISTCISTCIMIFCAMCWPTALNYGDRNPLCLPCDLHCYFWKIPNSQGALCFPSLCPKENKSLRVSNYNSWMEPQNTRQNPHCPESPCTAFALTGIIGATAVLMPFGHAFQHRPS